ncbi:MAG TPA: S8 family peptidase [Longimicrobiaceae bacterium]|nr:S8 family peptidase [Longimicrobiaceae bacterium]
MSERERPDRLMGHQGASTPLPEENPRKKPFLPDTLDRTVIAIPLLKELESIRGTGEERRPIDVIIDLNLEYPGGRKEARERVRTLVLEAVGSAGGDPDREAINETKSEFSPQYLFARMSGPAIRKLVELDGKGGGDDAGMPHAIYRIWNDFQIGPLISRSVSTVKADAARASFAAMGDGIVWAVMDSGIDGGHPHFELHDNLNPGAPLQHRDFTALNEAQGRPLEDPFGHGTHVGGIIAGEMLAKEGKPIRATIRLRDEEGNPTSEVKELEHISGIAPKAKLLSLRVLESDGTGLASSLIAAIGYVMELNGHGRRIRVHGVNLSVGYDFEPEWFACGQSPLCVEVDRLVRSGVVVVAAAGNTGYGFTDTEARGVVSAGLDLTINDPGNAELAITVGSTHREMPHVYGVSYFSSKGPTGDGRLKPDLVAPGEKILSCAARTPVVDGAPCHYREDSGTSMAAPHVSGVVAAFLSIRREFIGNPERVKEIFLSTATDLRRDRYFQGHGLVDLMRAIQSV